MATIRKETIVNVPADELWDALRDYGELHRRLAVGFVIESRLEGDDRFITFYNGANATERLVGVDETARRIAYSVTESPLDFTHHMASSQVLDEGEGRSRFVWITDCLPHDRAEAVEGMMTRGLEALRATVEREPVS